MLTYQIGFFPFIILFFFNMDIVHIKASYIVSLCVTPMYTCVIRNSFLIHL